MMKNALLTMAVAAACFSYGAQADEKTGGDIVVTYQNDVATLDPAIGYDWQNWSMIKSLFDGLMDYRPGTTELVNDLAESYAISEDGKVYTFVLRRGEIPQRPRGHGGGREIFSGTHSQPENPKSGRRVLQSHRGL
jgi:peptide/nickel transport system substrate-binding protein